MINAIGVTFESNGEQIETVSMPKPEFDALMFERKASRWVIVILMLALVATTGSVWLVNFQPRVTVIASPQTK